MIVVVLECYRGIFCEKMLYLASIDVNFCIKMIEKAQIWQFCHVLTYGWPKYHLLMFLMVVYIDGCSFGVLKRNILWKNALFGVNWRQFVYKNDRKSANLKIFACFDLWMAKIPSLEWFLRWSILMVLVLEWLRGLFCDLMLANWRQFEYEIIEKA